jgi:hypothetical protein
MIDLWSIAFDYEHCRRIRRHPSNLTMHRSKDAGKNSRAVGIYMLTKSGIDRSIWSSRWSAPRGVDRWRT